MRDRCTMHLCSCWFEKRCDEKENENAQVVSKTEHVLLDNGTLFVVGKCASASAIVTVERFTPKFTFQSRSKFVLSQLFIMLFSEICIFGHCRIVERTFVKRTK